MKETTIKSGREICWAKPVWVRVGNGFPEAVRGPAEALEKLSHRWPAERGRHYRTAAASCLAALSAQLEADLAREAFIRASTEARMLS
jgi:hypothetical protein